MESNHFAGQIVANRYNNLQNKEWKTIGVKVRMTDLPLVNRQLSRLNYNTLGDLVKDLISGKLPHITEDQQIDIMKTNLQTYDNTAFQISTEKLRT
jgi:hypothetical protein